MGKFVEVASGNPILWKEMRGPSPFLRTQKEGGPLLGREARQRTDGHELVEGWGNFLGIGLIR
jgi:hypothetical protein